MLNRLTRWLLAQRSSPRLAFLLQIGCRVLNALCGLVWARLLLQSMGTALNGLLLNFQAIASLGGLGDLGMGGLVSIQTGRLLGQDKSSELREFLSLARAFFGIMALLGAGLFLVLGTGLLRWQKFGTVPQVGSLAGLCVMGSLAIVLLLLNSYISNLNYGCGNVVWPILPGFVIVQLGFLGHWLLARQGASLWVQYLPYQAGSLLIFLLGWVWIRLSHVSLGTIWPLKVDWRQFLVLAGKSFWVYLCILSTSIYAAISTLLITPRFGPELLATYRYNNRLCELAYFVVNSACFVSLPKITQWLASPAAETRERGARETERLNKFQALLGCSAATVYLVINDWFIRVWLGQDLQAPLSWQAAFAAYLAVASGGMVGFELAARCSEGGLRVAGIVAAATALLNLVLSLVAVKLGSVFGIALATFVSSTVLTLGLGWYTCRQIQVSWWRLSLRNWLLGLAVTGAAVLVRVYLPVTSALTAGLTAAFCLATTVLVACILGIRIKDLQEEFAILRGMLGKR